MLRSVLVSWPAGVAVNSETQELFFSQCWNGQTKLVLKETYWVRQECYQQIFWVICHKVYHKFCMKTHCFDHIVWKHKERWHFYVAMFIVSPSFRTKLTQINVFFLNYMSTYLTRKNVYFIVKISFLLFGLLLGFSSFNQWGSVSVLQLQPIFPFVPLSSESDLSLKQVSHCVQF